MIVVLALIVVIPILVYQGLKLWLEVERSPYPEIDFAWKAGIQASRRERAVASNDSRFSDARIGE